MSNNSFKGLTPDGLRALARHLPDASAPDEHNLRVIPQAEHRPHRLSSRLTPEQIAAARSRYEAGESATAIARSLNIAPSAFLRLLREQGVIIRTSTISPELKTQLVTEHEAGATMRELEGKYGLSHGTVFRAVHKH